MILGKMNDDNGTTSTLDDRYSYDNYDNALGASIFSFLVSFFLLCRQSTFGTSVIIRMTLVVIHNSILIIYTRPNHDRSLFTYSKTLGLVVFFQVSDFKCIYKYTSPDAF